MRTLRKYLLATATLFVLLISLAAAYLVREVGSYGRHQTESQLLDTTRALSLVVDSELESHEAILKALATSEALDRGDYRAFDAQARKLLSGSDAWIVLGRRDGHQLVNTRLPAGAPLPTGPAPTHIWPTLDRGETRICDLAQGRLEPRTLCVDLPVMRDGRAAFHLSVVFRPQLLQKLMEKQKLPASRYGTILDRKGRVVWRNVDPEKFVGRPATPDMLAALALRTEGVKESVSLTGVPTLAAYSRSPRSGWAFIVAVPRAELALGSRNALHSGLSIAGLLLLLAALVAVGAGHRLSEAIRRLSTAAAHVGHGRLPELPPSGIAEIDDVGAALRRSHAAREESDERFQLAQEVGGIGSWDWDLVTGRGHVSDSYKRMHGLSHIDGPLTMEHVYGVMHPGDREAYTARLNAAKQGTEPATNEYRVIHADGSIHWVAAKGRALFDADGRLARAVGVVRDITAERGAELALRASEAELRQITDALPVLISHVDRHERYRFNNRAYESWFAVSREENCGRHIREAVGDENYARVKPFVDRALAGEHCAFEWKGVHPRTGDARFYRSEYIPRRDDDGAPDGFYVFFSDITDIKKTEARLQELNVALEETVAARTIELTEALSSLRRETGERQRAEEALRQSQKLEAIGKVAGGIAHDFNNLLTPILGGLDMLRQRGLDARGQRLVEGSLAAAERARLLVQRLLAFARRQPLQPSAVDIGELALGMRDLIASTLGPRIRVVTQVAPELPRARADQNQLEMALLNLAVNARDAMPDGGTLTISVDTAEFGDDNDIDVPSGRYVRLGVVDTGTGMPDEVIRRAVEPFFSTKGIGKGTGLGLSMVHGLAAQLGGALKLTSAIGVGTNVEIWLPAARADVIEAPPSEKDPTRLDARGTVLVVDDEDLIRESVAQMLSGLGYMVVEAGSATQALSLLESGLQVDLLVTDHLMPGMTGTELAQVVDERQLVPSVLIISGYADVEDIAPGLARLTKPFRQDELAMAIRGLVPPMAARPEALPAMSPTSARGR